MFPMAFKAYQISIFLMLAAVLSVVSEVLRAGRASDGS